MILNFRTIILYSLFEILRFVCLQPNENAAAKRFGLLSGHLYTTIRPNTACTAKCINVIE